MGEIEKSMAYIKLSESESKNQYISISNIFIAEYMPLAPESFVKVYLTALSFSTIADNDESSLALRLNLEPKVIADAFAYWQEQGLCRVLATNPIQIELLPVVSKSRQIRKFSKEKYRTFNDQLHALLPNRNILPAEYNEYYNIIEQHNFEIEAMLIIVAYCKRLKGDDIAYQYIVTVARNLAAEGYTTYERVNEKLSEFDLYTPELKALFKALGLKKSADHDDKRLYLKWTKALGFKVETLIQVAKTIKKGGMQRLDYSLSKYYENRLMSIEEITAYEKERDFMFDLARTVNKIIGVYYEQLDSIIETYITSWLSMGFNKDSITTIAEYCFKKGIRTLEGMSETLNKFFRLGHVTISSISSFITQAVKSDELIIEVIDALGLTRGVNTRDRDYYRTWTYSWNMPHDVILYAATISKAAQSPLSYLNGVLSNYHSNSITTVEAAKKSGNAMPQSEVAASKSNIISCDYSATELNAIFDKLNDDLLGRN